MTETASLTVTQAMSLARGALETVTVQVLGEVSEFNDKPGYKAAYFTVCDEGASMSSMMWRDAYVASGVQLRCGMLVQMSGTFSAYIPKGRMQFMVKSLALAGEGMLRMQVAELARKLELDGLMRADRKRRLPSHPRKIAVVTSPRGKAVHDVIRTLRRRYPLAEVLVAGVTVEGTGAPRAIVDGMKAAADAGAEVILLVRGGGSYEDLMPFNHELVARTIAACPVPVVTGIGHEPDVSIADMVSDVHASTPTAAAEAVAPSVDELSATLDKTQRLLGRALQQRVQEARHRLRVLAGRPVFRDHAALVGPAWQTLDNLSTGLGRAIPLRLERDAQRLGYLRERVVRVGPHIVEGFAQDVKAGAARLHDLSPLAILGRGYAVCFADDGLRVVKSYSDVEVGDCVTVRLGTGRIGCRVDSTEETEG